MTVYVELFWRHNAPYAIIADRHILSKAFQVANERRTVRFDGNVQGVGFRYTACRVAGQFEVTGYVRNLPDGAVECVIEGPCQKIDSFLTELRRRMGDYISGITQQTAVGTGSFRSFGVRY